MKGILLAAMNVVLILFTVLVHKIIFRILGLGYDSLVVYWGLFVLIFFILDLPSSSAIRRVVVTLIPDIAKVVVITCMLIIS